MATKLNSVTCGGYRTPVTTHDEMRGYTRCSCGKVVKLRYTLERKEDVYIPRHKPEGSSNA